MKVMFETQRGHQRYTEHIPKARMTPRGFPRSEQVNFDTEESMHARLAETMDYVEEKRKELLQTFTGVPGDRLTRHPSNGGWSVAEILDHLGIVESGVARLIAKRAGRAREAGLGEEKSTESVLPAFDGYRARLDSMKLQSPETVKPRADVDIKDALQGLESSRQALRVAVATADGLALSEIKHTHPILGEIDLYQWIIFLGQHELRHRNQIERTLNSIPK
jgi:hypothetical protein